MERRFDVKMSLKIFVEFGATIILGFVFYISYGFGAAGLFITGLTYLSLTYMIGSISGAFLDPDKIIGTLVAVELDSFGKSKDPHGFPWRGYRFVNALLVFIVIYIGTFIGALLAFLVSGTANSVVITSSVFTGIGTEIIVVTFWVLGYLFVFDTDLSYSVTVVLRDEKNQKLMNHKNPNNYHGLVVGFFFFALSLSTAAISGGVLNPALALNANLVFLIAGGGSGPLSSSGWLTLAGFIGAIIAGLLYLLIKWWYLSDYRRKRTQYHHEPRRTTY